MKKLNSINWPFVIILLGVAVAVFLWLKGCSSDPEVIKVTHPAVSGTTKISKPESKPLVQELSTEPNKVSTEPFGQNMSKAELDRWKAIADSLLNANIQMQIAFAKSKNKDSLYKEVTTPKQFSKTWDDENLTATVNGMYYGAIPAIQLDYDIKPRTQEVKLPQTVFRLLGGVEAGMTKDLSKFSAKANIGLQNKKGNIITLAADTEQRFYVGYNFSIFSIKK
ncbi:hypothetical protein [Flavobacterium sp. 25HG05S-40]|uniref:hypothetical protein n=1 Tax=Flavobacterium sp. 25HG05S-40 TaxID=3458682 RepID=UPI004043E9EA